MAQGFAADDFAVEIFVGKIEAKLSGVVGDFLLMEEDASGDGFV